MSIPDKDDPTLFELLRDGCTVDFGCGYGLRGDVRNKYIDVLRENVETGRTDQHDGCWELSPEGLKNAMEDVRRMKAADDCEREDSGG